MSEKLKSLTNYCAPKIVDDEADFKLVSRHTELTLHYRSRSISGKSARIVREISHRSKGICILEIDDDAKEIVREIGTAINESVENSPKVAEAIERLRDAGYEMELTLRLEIGLRPNPGTEGPGETALNLTEEDVQILQRMKIRIDPES